MSDLFFWLQLVCLTPVFGGSVYGFLCAAAVWNFFHRPQTPAESLAIWPAVSILKPIHGLEKNLAENLRSVCNQDYPNYQVVLAVQRLNDPALPLIEQIQREFGAQRVTVVVADCQPVVNGKIQNLVNALGAARHEILVISDSDVLLRPDYLKAIVAPLSDPQVGYACTLYRSTRADTWFERLELLNINADSTVNILFAEMSGASDYCLGSSLALRRSTLEQIGGLQSLADYLAEDYELGRRIQAQGLRMVLVPYVVDLIVDLSGPTDWWRHQLYWDLNTRAARPIGFFATVLTRSLPFALLFAAMRLFDSLSLLVLTAALAIRLGTTGFILKIGLRDREGLGNLALLPLRDLAGLATWLIALGKRTVVWRGLKFGLTRDGRLVPRQASS